MRISRPLSVILSVLICSFAVLSGCAEKETADPERFTAPDDYSSVLQITINPTVNLYLDKYNVIVAVEYVNSDARTAYSSAEDAIVKASLETGIDTVIKSAIDAGFLENVSQLSLDIIKVKNGAFEYSVLKSADDYTLSALSKYEMNIAVNTLLYGKAVDRSEIEAKIKEMERNKTKPKQVSQTESTEEDTDISQVAENEEMTSSVEETQSEPNESSKETGTESIVKTGKQYVCYQVKDKKLNVFQLRFTSGGICIFSEEKYTECDTPETAGDLGYNGKNYSLSDSINENASYFEEDGEVAVKMNNGGMFKLLAVSDKLEVKSADKTDVEANDKFVLKN